MIQVFQQVKTAASTDLEDITVDTRHFDGNERDFQEHQAGYITNRNKTTKYPMDSQKSSSTQHIPTSQMKPPTTGGPQVHSGGTSAEGFKMALKRVYTQEEAAAIKKQEPGRRVRSQMGVEYEYMAATIRVGPTPPNDGNGWEETKLSPIVDGEPYTLPNGMIITETVKAWMHVDGPAGY
ncbi:hypothetical protein COCOBI_06-5070 [Coccomyxa sp. Obi]|nr:hypothetical protein COCOBI_06-5070 [Coccomyxa sp. Obi]